MYIYFPFSLFSLPCVHIYLCMCLFILCGLYNNVLNVQNFFVVRSVYVLRIRYTNILSSQVKGFIRGDAGGFE